MPTRRPTPVATVALLVLAALSLVVAALPVLARPASALAAHAQLVRTTPADGARVDTVDAVSMTFSEDVNARFLRVAVDGPGGDEADGGPTAEGGTVRQDLVDDLGAGVHTVTYRVVSVDGHPVAGSFTFTTTAASSAGATPEGTASTSPAPDPTASAPGSSPSATPGADTASDPVAATGGVGSSWALPAVLVVLAAALLTAGVLLARRRPARGDDGGGGPG